jgi:hypothetical protein
VSLASGGILFYYLIPTLISIYTQRLTEMLPDLLEIAGEAIAAMQEVIIEKLSLFGSIGKAHLHETPYAEMLSSQAYK